MQYRYFDAHTHAFPQKISAETVRMLGRKAGIPYHHGGGFEDLAAYERAAGVSAFLLCPIATRPGSVRSVNTWAAAAAGGGAYAFGSLHPAAEDPRADLEHLAALGLLGVKLHPEYQEFYVDDDALFPFFNTIFSGGLPVCLHAGMDLGFSTPPRGGARRIARLARRFPEGRIIAAHMGGLFQTEAVCEELAGLPNVWMDTSFAAQRMTAEEILRLVRLAGARRFFFGTDAPWASFAESRDALLRAGLAEEELKMIFWDNITDFLGIEAKE